MVSNPLTYKKRNGVARGSNPSAPPTSKKIMTSNWNELAKLSQQGDKRAYNALLSEIFSYVRNYLIGGLSNTDAAEDVAQDVLVSVHKSLQTYSPDMPFKPWLMAIVHFRRADWLRSHYAGRKNMQTDLEDVGFQKQHVTNPALAGEWKDMEAALNRLPEKQRALFTLVRIEGYSMEEAADRMEMTVSAVKVSIHRTLKKLQGEL